MPVLHEQDFDKLAARVVDRFMSGQAKLADAAAEEASAAQMNPDQIERLSQSANVMAFLRMMDQQKSQGAGDLMQEFDPIDARHVIRIVIDNAGVHVEPMDGDAGMHDEQHELPDEMHGEMPEDGMNPPEGAPGHYDSPEVEECEEECHEEHDPPGMTTPKKSAPPMAAKGKKPFPPKKDKAEKKDDEETEEKPETPKQAMVRKRSMRKLADILEDQYKQAEWVFEDTFDTLMGRFKRAHIETTYEEFEKDALAEYGDAIGVSVLNMVRVARGLPQIEATAHEKTAAEADRHVSLDTPELRLFDQLVKVATDADKLRQGVDYLRVQCA